jgi:hypothetical protein
MIKHHRTKLKLLGIFPMLNLLANLFFLSTPTYAAKKDENNPHHEKGMEAYKNGDFSTAHAEFDLSAQDGVAKSQFNLGLMFANGTGVQQNYAEAVKWFRLAGDQGLVAAKAALGQAYMEGKGVLKDDQMGVNLLKSAADQGFAPAQHGLGVLYERGNGVVKNIGEAIKWYTLAANQGNEFAISRLKKVQATQEIPVDNDRLVNIRAGKLTIAGEMNGMQLFFNGKKLDAGADSATLRFNDSFKNKYSFSDRDVILVNDGTSATCAMYFFVTVESKPTETASLTPTFGTCDDGPKVTQNGNKIILIMKDMKGKNKKFVYENGVVTNNGVRVK